MKGQHCPDLALHLFGGQAVLAEHLRQVATPTPPKGDERKDVNPAAIPSSGRFGGAL